MRYYNIQSIRAKMPAKGHPPAVPVLAITCTHPVRRTLVCINSDDDILLRTHSKSARSLLKLLALPETLTRYSRELRVRIVQTFVHHRRPPDRRLRSDLLRPHPTSIRFFAANLLSLLPIAHGPAGLDQIHRFRPIRRILPEPKIRILRFPRGGEMRRPWRSRKT